MGKKKKFVTNSGFCQKMAANVCPDILWRLRAGMSDISQRLWGFPGEILQCKMADNAGQSSPLSRCSCKAMTTTEVESTND